MAGGEQHKSERDELGNIDFFLDHLARAVERGEVPRASYDFLAPRYLERRKDLVSIISGGTPQSAPSAPAVGASLTTGAAAAESVAPSHQASASIPAPAPFSRPQKKPREPVAWTTVLTFTGAFLVIVASAIFAVATWDMFGVTFKLLFLGALTAGFYAAGRLVRTKLKLAGGGVALTVVASAMLLFDGWIAIDGFGWTGVWPWVAWLVACSAVYWYTETSMGSGFFGVTGAAAQVAWVWLLGDGLGWQDTQRAAAIACVAVAWALAGRMAQHKGPFASLAGVLHLAAPVTVLLSALLCLGGILIGPTGWAEIVPALIVGVAATAIVQIAGLPPGIGALGHLPAFIAIGSVHGGPDGGHAALLFGMAVAYVVYELYAGGWGHGVLALVAELGAWVALSVRFDWANDVTLAVLVALAVSWSAAAWLIGRTQADSGRRIGPHYAGALSLGHITLYGGWALLTITTLLMPLVTQVVPLSGVDVLARDAALAIGILAAWFALASLHRFPPAAIGSFLMSFWAAAALLAWAFPSWYSAYYAIAMLAVAAKWFMGRHHVERMTGLPATVLAWMARASTLLIVSMGLAAAEYYSEAVSLPAAWLLAATAAWWLLDALTAQEFRAGFAISSALTALAVAVAVAARTEADATAAIAAALTALALVALGAWLRRRPGWGREWVWGAAVTGVVVALLALDDPGSLAVALALAAAACILAAWTSDFVEAAAGGGLVAIGALIACAAWIDADPWVLFALVALPSLAMLAPPALLRQGAPGTTMTRWFDAGLASGFAGISVLVLFPILTGNGLYAVAGWADLGEHGLAAALLVLGAYVMAASALKDLELGTYVGVGLVVAAYLVERGALNVGTAEWVSTPIALYIAWIGYQWARTHDTKVPLATDIAVALVALAPPALLAATTFARAEPWVHLVWAVALSLIAIAAGVTLRVRAYFFGGVAAIVFTAVARSWIYLVSFWWLVLGLIGITMLVVALTWERQHSLVAGAKNRMQAALSDWR